MMTDHDDERRHGWGAMLLLAAAACLLALALPGCVSPEARVGMTQLAQDCADLYDYTTPEQVARPSVLQPGGNLAPPSPVDRLAKIHALAGAMRELALQECLAIDAPTSTATTGGSH